MSVGVDDDTADSITLDIDDFVIKFEAWYKEDGESINPYDATTRFIDYYANKQLFLPFARRKLRVLYVLNISFISMIGLTLASFIAVFISLLSGDPSSLMIFVTSAFVSVITHIITRIILRIMSKRESDISVAVINYKNALTDVIYPAGRLADFINSITKQRPIPTPKDDTISSL